MGTALDRASSVKDLYQRGSAYGIPRRDVNGMDLIAFDRQNVPNGWHGTPRQATRVICFVPPAAEMNTTVPRGGNNQTCQK